MKVDIERIAEEIRKAIGDGKQPLDSVTVMVPYYAEKVEIMHAEGSKVNKDFVMSGKEYGLFEVANFKWFVKEMPDWHLVGAKVWVEGNQIHVYDALVGTLPDGKVNISRYTVTYVFNDDSKIHQTILEIDPRDIADSEKLLKMQENRPDYPKYTWLNNN